MRKFINNLGLVAIALAVSVTIYTQTRPDYSTKITYEKIEKIDPVIIIDSATLMTPEYAYEAVKSLDEAIRFLGPFAPLVFKGQTINVIIESYGGRVDLGYKIITHVNTLKRKLGFKVKCYVKTAASMAFTVMLAICDERVGLKGLILMQHPVSYSNGDQTVRTKIMDRDVNRREARLLGVPEKEWLKISKQDGDHLFTKAEIKKYNLIHSYDKKNVPSKDKK